MVALVCGWMAVHMLLLGSVSHDRQQDLLYDDFRRSLASAGAPTGPTVVDEDGEERLVAPGEPVAIVRIPAIGLEEVVVEGTAAGDLFAGPGHVRNTVLPGQEGTSVVYGRRTTYGAPFGRLDELVPGDTVQVVMGQGEFDFTVTGVRRDGDPLPQPRAEGTARMTLVTAGGDGWTGALAPGPTMYVDAETTDAVAAAGGRSPVVPESEEAMARGTAALPTLCLCVVLLTALVCAVIAARQRWSLGLVWVIAAPPSLALAWLTTDSAMRLLPNLI